MRIQPSCEWINFLLQLFISFACDERAKTKIDASHRHKIQRKCEQSHLLISHLYQKLFALISVDFNQSIADDIFLSIYFWGFDGKIVLIQVQQCQPWTRAFAIAESVVCRTTFSISLYVKRNMHMIMCTHMQTIMLLFAALV